MGKAGIGLIPVSREIYDRTPARTVSVSGFQGIAIMQSSRHHDEAWNYVRFVTSPAHQDCFADEIPVWKSLVNSEALRARDPFLELEKIELSSLCHRPGLIDYRDFSRILQKYLYCALQRQMTPREALDRATGDLRHRQYPFTQ